MKRKRIEGGGEGRGGGTDICNQNKKEKERQMERKKANKCVTVAILQFQNERLVISDLKTEYEERPKKK